MKVFAILTLGLATAFSTSSAAPTMAELSSHLFTNASVVWQAPTNHLPKGFWIYQRLLPRVFSATVISNAIVFGSLQSKGFPQPSTNQTCIMAEPPCPCGNVCNFFIRCITEGIPSDEVIAKRAWDYALQLGLDPKHLIQKTFYTHLYNFDQTDKGVTNFICGRGIFLSRQLDSITFFSNENEGDGAEGFSIEFGSYGQIRFFSLHWSNVERYKKQQTASSQQIIHCIKAHKTIVLPNVGEMDYFGRLRTLANAKKLTIIKITPYYGEWVFGEIPTNDVPCKFVTPFAELEAVADFGSSNATVRLLSPILSSEAIKLLEGKTK